MPQTKEEKNEKERARMAAQTPEEKAKTAARQKEWQKDHREKRNAQQRARNATHREEINANMRARNATPEGKARRKKNSRARTLRRNPDAREQDRFYGTDAERFEHYIDRSITVEIDDRAVPSCPLDPCLIGWKANRITSYPVMTVSGVGQVLVHRWLWANEHGEIPEKFDVRHLCNNGGLGCLTLSHLSADTRTQNSADKVQNGTALRSLRPQTVRGIRWLHSLGYTNQSELARMYGTTQGIVRDIIEGRSYKEVTL